MDRDVNQSFPWFSTRSGREGSLIVKGADGIIMNLGRTGEERRQQTLCDKRDNNFV